MRLEQREPRIVIAGAIAALDVALAAMIPFLFFMSMFAVLMVLGFPAGLALARWQFAGTPWQVRQHTALVSLGCLVGLGFVMATVWILGKQDPTAFESQAALMLLAVAWAPLSTFTIGALSVRGTFRPYRPVQPS